MKTNYNRLASRGWVWLLWALSLTSSVNAQLTMPPVLQWQKVIEGGIDADSKTKLAVASTGDYGVLNGTQLSYLHPSGALRLSGIIEGSTLISSSPVQYSPVLKTAGLAPTADGGFVVLANDATNLYILKKDANTNRIWSTNIAASDYQSNADQFVGLEILATSDGGYLVFASHRLAGYLTTIYVAKTNSVGTVLWSRDVYSPQASNGTGILFRGFSGVAAFSDGSYVITGGQFSPLKRPNPIQGFAVKIDGQANPLWTRAYDGVVAFSDQVTYPYESATLLVMGVTDPSFSGNNNGPTFPYKMQADGSLLKLGVTSFSSQSRIGSYVYMQPQYVVLEPVSQNGGDFKLTGMNQLNEPVWTKTLGGSSADLPQALLTTDDGYLLGGTTTSSDGDVQGKQGNALATWVVKLNKTPNPLALTTPTYDCVTGAFTFNTTGGDGSLIEYFAAGITGFTTNPNQFVDRDSRTANDVQPFQLLARQNGRIATLVWDLKAACGRGTSALPPVARAIPDQVLTVGQSLYLTLGQYIYDPTYNVPNYAPRWSYSVDGLPAALYPFARPTDLQYVPQLPVVILGTATTAGVYLVTVRASTEAFRNNPVSTTFKITVLPTTPPSGGALTLTTPTYDCATGAFTFNTTGGDGSLIEYFAAGITGWTTNPSHFVDRDSRTANDVQPFQLMARQNGQTVTLVWDLKAACGRARVGIGEPTAGMQIRVLGNPVVSQTAELEITGVLDQVVHYNLVDAQGRVLHQRSIERASYMERVSLPIGPTTGLYLLRVQTANEQQTVKLLKR